MSFKVGFRQGLCPDPVRSSWSGDGPRPLRWSVWYPAHPAVETVAVEMPPGARYYLLGELALDAAPAAVVERLPVVLLSHGTGGTAASLGWLARRLAAAAWAVLGVDHHGNAASEPHCAAGFICWWERSRDLSLALDMLATAGPFAGRLEQDRVVAAGFSLGAHTALALAGGHHRHAPVCGLDRRPAGRVRTAGVPRPRRSAARAAGDRCRLPVAIAVGEADREAPPEDGACWLADQLPNCSLTFLGAAVGHSALLASGTPAGRAAMPELWADPPGVDRASVHERVARLALATFAQ